MKVPQHLIITGIASMVIACSVASVPAQAKNPWNDKQLNAIAMQDYIAVQQQKAADAVVAQQQQAAQQVALQQYLQQQQIAQQQANYQAQLQQTAACLAPAYVPPAPVYMTPSAMYNSRSNWHHRHYR